MTGYQVVYATAFAQAFTHWLQVRGLDAPGYVFYGAFATETQILDARAYAAQQAELCAEQWAAATNLHTSK